MILFPDTNFFLQFRDPAEIPWADVGAGGDVTLMVCRAVQSEIDDLKGNDNARRAARARKVSAQFRTIVLSNSPLALREANPRVVLEFAPRPDFDVSSAPPFSKIDHQIVAEALAAAALLGGQSALLTDDTGMMLTAKDRGLTFVPTPEGWRLPPEKDERDKQMDELKAQVARLSRNVPELTVEVTSKEQPVTAPMIVRRIDYRPLSQALIEELTGVLEERFPMKTDCSREADINVAIAEATRFVNQRTIAGLMASDLVSSLGAEEWKPPSENSIENYHGAYAKWLGEARLFLANLHTALPGRSGQTPLSFSLRNGGTVPADQVRVDIEALGGLLLARRPKKDAAVPPPVALPAAPEAPAWKAVMSGSLGSVMQTLQVMQGAIGGANPFVHEGFGHFVPPFYPEPPHVEDPHAFYWRDGPPSRSIATWRYRCGELRHQAEAEVFAALLVAPAENGVTKGAIRFRASARNLPEPIERTVVVRVEVEAGDTEAAARELMPKPRLKLEFKGRKSGH